MRGDAAARQRRTAAQGCLLVPAGVPRVSANPTKNGVLLQVRDLKKHFHIPGGLLVNRQGKMLKAVDGVSFEIRRGETFGLVGESGCGKTTLGQTIVRLYEPTSGQILFDGTDISTLSDDKLRPL